MTARLRAPRQESGASAVEFALVLVILIPLLFGILQYGFYFWSTQSANAAAREGARRAAVGDLSTCGSTSLPASGTFRDYVYKQVGAAGQKPITVKRSYTDGPGNSDPAVQIGDELTVTVEFDAYNIGILPLPLGGKVKATAESRVENVKSTPEVCS